VDPSFQMARAAGVASDDPATFSWISFENTDKDLIRFLSTRTSVHESILAPDDLSALVLSFSGRTSVALCGTTSRAPANRYIELMRGFYRDENSFYDLCKREKVDYVIYTVDMLLDGGLYSPIYMTGISGVAPDAVAVKMHFQPESLRHFTLLYENEHYRLFKVTETAQPVFLTDHPLYYQSRLFMDSGASFEHFRQRVLWLMANCAAGMGARARGDLDKSRQILDQCVRYAPLFTRARLELAYTFMDLGREEKARDQIKAVIQYAPDNAAALYIAAYLEVQAGHPDDAKPYLTLLAQSGDRSFVDKGKGLQYYIDHKLPLKPGAPQ
jgi:tetratricopeptide (TPR) repeat protein